MNLKNNCEFNDCSQTLKYLNFKTYFESFKNIYKFYKY